MVPFDRAAHMDSLVAAAFVGSAFQLDDPLPSCSLVRVAAVQDLVEDFEHGHPTVDLVDLRWYQQADTLEDERPVAAVLLLGLADRSLVGL